MPGKGVTVGVGVGVGVAARMLYLFIRYISTDIRSAGVNARSYMMTSDNRVAFMAVVCVSPVANTDVEDARELGIVLEGVNVNSEPLVVWYESTPEPPTTSADTYR